MASAPTSAAVKVRATEGTKIIEVHEEKTNKFISVFFVRFDLFVFFVV